MKSFAILMTILMIFAGFDLCQDKDIMDSDDPIEVANAGKDNPEESDVCSPFCHCALCPFSIMLPQQKPLFLAYQPSKNIFTLTRSGSPTRISPSIWQPPKVA